MTLVEFIDASYIGSEHKIAVNLESIIAAEETNNMTKLYLCNNRSFAVKNSYASVKATIEDLTGQNVVLCFTEMKEVESNEL